MVALRQLAVLEHLGLDNSRQKATEDHALHTTRQLQADVYLWWWFFGKIAPKRTKKIWVFIKPSPYINSTNLYYFPRSTNWFRQNLFPKFEQKLREMFWFHNYQKNSGIGLTFGLVCVNILSFSDKSSCWWNNVAKHFSKISSIFNSNILPQSIWILGQNHL